MGPSGRVIEHSNPTDVVRTGRQAVIPMQKSSQEPENSSSSGRRAASSRRVKHSSIGELHTAKLRLRISTRRKRARHDRPHATHRLRGLQPTPRRPGGRVALPQDAQSTMPTTRAPCRDRRRTHLHHGVRMLELVPRSHSVKGYLPHHIAPAAHPQYRAAAWRWT
jgi:hypothetical protein